MGIFPKMGINILGGGLYWTAKGAGIQPLSSNFRRLMSVRVSFSPVYFL